MGGECTSCGLRLQGPEAERLRSVDAALHRLSLERRSLIEALQAGRPHEAPPEAAAPPAATTAWLAPPSRNWAPPPRPGGWAGSDEPPLPPPSRRHAHSEFPGDGGAPPLQIQNVLLSLGAFSLIVAAVVFLAVTWRGLSAPTKSLTLVGLTLVFAAITRVLRRRSLSSTSEAIAAVTVMLGVADAYAIRIGLFTGVSRSVFWGVASAVLALVLVGFASWSGAVVGRLAAVVLVQLSAPLLAAGRSPSNTVLLGVLLLQSLAVLAILSRRPTMDRLVVRILRGGAGVAWTAGIAGAARLALTTEASRPLAAGLLVVAGVVAGVVAWRWPEEAELQGIASTVAAASALAAATTLAARWLDGTGLAFTVAGSAVVLGVAVAQIGRRWATGPAVLAGAVAIGASAPAWPELGAALQAPWSAVSQSGAWSLSADRVARSVGVPHPIGAGPGSALGFLALLGLGVVGARVRIGRMASRWMLASLGGLVAFVVPFAVGASLWGATLILLASAALVGGAVLWRFARGVPTEELLPWWALVVGVGGQGLTWALQAPGLTLAAVSTVAVIAGAAVVVAVRRAAPPVAYAATAVMSVSLSGSVPVALHVLGASPAVGWTVLGVVAAVVSGPCFNVRYRSIGAEARAVPLGAKVVGLAGGVAGASYVVAAVGAISLVSRPAVPGLLAGILGAGALAALLIAGLSIRRELVEGTSMATAASALLSLGAAGAAAVQAGLAPASVWLVVLVATAALTLIAMLSEITTLPVDVAGALDGSAAVVATIALGALVAVGRANQISIGLLVVTIALGAAATRPSRRPAVAGAAVGALVLLWQRLALAGVTTAEAFTLPAAVFLGSVAIWGHRRAPDESSWTTWGPALVVGLGPSVLLALRDPGLLRPVATVIAAAAVTLVGARWQRRAPMAIGAAALVALGAQQLGPFVRQLPRWVTFAAVGTLLLLVGASYERRRAQLVGLRAHYRRLR